MAIYFQHGFCGHLKHKMLAVAPSARNRISNEWRGINEEKVFVNLYGDLIYWKPKKPKFTIGDKVRISKYKGRVFDKGYTPNWTEEVFVVDKVLPAKPVTYEIVDSMGEEIEGSFYEKELQKAKQQTFRIEKVIRRDKKKEKALVKWKGYCDKFNSWVSFKNLVNF